MGLSHYWSSGKLPEALEESLVSSISTFQGTFSAQVEEPPITFTKEYVEHIDNNAKNTPVLKVPL